MKNKTLVLAFGIVTALGIGIHGCNTKNRQGENSISTNTLDGSGETYVVDTTASVIEWIGGTPTNNTHTGNLRLREGKLTANENRLTGGSFVINIQSINNTDQSGQDKLDLENHLKNSDFFEVEKFPTGAFEITQTKTDSAGQKIIGNLTLKGKTNAIEIPVTLHIDEKTITAASAQFAIDRTKWGIVYSSGVIGTLKDDLINDEVLITLKLVATRKP